MSLSLLFISTDDDLSHTFHFPIKGLSWPKNKFQYIKYLQQDQATAKISIQIIHIWADPNAVHPITESCRKKQNIDMLRQKGLIINKINYYDIKLF